MPGIFGAVLRGEPVARQAHPVLPEPLPPFDRYVCQRHSGPLAGLGSLGRDQRQRLFRLDPAEGGPLVGVMAGELHDVEWGRQTLAAGGCRCVGDSHVELLIRGFAVFGTAFLPQVSGSFVAAIWHAGTRRLVVCNDRLGLRTVHYRIEPGSLAFSFAIKPLMHAPGSSERSGGHGIAPSFGVRHLPGETSPFEAIEVLPAAGLLTFSAATGMVSRACYGAHGAALASPAPSGGARGASNSLA